MGDEVLSQAEVESLLNAMEQGGDAAQTVASAGGMEPAATRRTSAPSVGRKAKVTPYDFKRPERGGKEQMRALQTLHEGFGRNYGAALSALLRTIVEVKLTSVDQLTYSEFVFSLENPTCFNLLKADPLDGNLILDINPSILFPIIDRLLGGGTEPTPIERRPLTEIELRLVACITELFLEELKKAWANVVELELAVERVESNPQLVQIVPPNEVVVLIGFEITLGGVRGMMNLCIPFNSIERVAHQLSSNSWFSYAKASATDETRGTIGEQVSGSVVDLEVTLARSTITSADLFQLRVGDIIATEHDVHAPLEVTVSGVPKFHARAGAYKGRKAIELLGVIEKEPRSK